MHICYLADARSSIAQNWIAHFAASGRHRVTVISSYPCAPDAIPGARVIEFPFVLSSLSPGSKQGEVTTRSNFLARVRSEFRSRRFLETVSRVRSWIAPVDIARKTKAMNALIEAVQPDLVHAMRLPFEGFLAAAAVKSSRLLLSVWGNDFTLFADRNRKLGKLADAALRRADGLHCDCHRDLQIAFTRGYSPTKPWRVLPGNGGVDSAAYLASRPDPTLLQKFDIPAGVPVVLNPRGFRAYIRNDVFFRAIPLVLKQVPEAFFVAVGMAGNPVAERWVRRMRIQQSLRLLPLLSRPQLASLFAASQVSVSPSSHDGTPNTLLEAMACGCFPVVGNVTSLREWIVNGENGMICDENDAESLVSCIVRALCDKDLRVGAANINRQLIRTRAEYANVMLEAEKLYDEVVRGTTELSLSQVSCGEVLTKSAVCGE